MQPLVPGLLQQPCIGQFKCKDASNLFSIHINCLVGEGHLGFERKDLSRTYHIMPLSVPGIPLSIALASSSGFSDANP